MNKEQYYKLSNEKKLPLRCPILNYCQRRAYTIYYNSKYNIFDSGYTMEEALLKDGTLPNDFPKNKIPIQGEQPYWISGNNHYIFGGMCPEVNLFDNSNSLIKDNACTSASHDDELPPPKTKILKTQHYSECSEFNKHLFDVSSKTSKILRKPRKSIPQTTKAKLQKEINSICPFCKIEDVEHFHIHHIDEEPTNNEFSNLLMLCPTCHSKITKGDFSTNLVVETKLNLKK